MNTIKIGGICLALLFGAVLITNTFAAQSTEGTFKIAAPLPDVPSEIFTLIPVDQGISKEHAQQITERVLGIKGEAADKGNAWHIKNDTKEIIIYKHGAIKYIDEAETFEKMHNVSEMPGEKEASATAQGIFHKLADEGLLQRELIPASLKIEDDEGRIYKNGTIESFLLNRHVNAPLSYNGVPLDGAGAKLRIYLSKNGEVTGLLNFVGKLEPDKKVSVLTPSEAIETLKARGYRNVTVESFEFVYEVPPPSETKSIIPVYIFKGKMFGKDGSVAGFAQVVPAIRNQ
ncbi:MAG: hypothetical protein OIN66_06115 [Candidatus Methanoperedens sp.]|nr:hypothetical protein [Candidatus Methanoperedens sp.]